VSTEANATPDEPSFGEQSGVLSYTLLCLGALAVIVLSTFAEGKAVTTLLALVIGVPGLLLRWRLAPVLLLVVVAWGELYLVLSMLGPGWMPVTRWRFNPLDVVLSAAVLAYVAGHYRLQALTRHVVPIDPRERAGEPRWDLARMRSLPPVVRRARSRRLITAEEVSLLLLTLPGWALLGQICGLLLTLPGPLFGLSPLGSQLVLVVWMLGIVGLVTASIVGHIRDRQMGPQEATLLLQEVVWEQTRREQRRLQRWAAWGLQGRRQG
jgi:hypothetical protein